MYAHIESVITQGSLHLEYNVWYMNVHYNVFHKCFFSATKSSCVISGKLFDYIMPQLEIVYHFPKIGTNFRPGERLTLVSKHFQHLFKLWIPFSNTANWRFFYYNFFCMLTLSLTYTCCNNALLSSILMPLWCQRTVPYSWIDMSFIKVNDLSHIFIVVGLPKNGRFPPEFFSWKPFFNCFIVDRSIH